MNTQRTLEFHEDSKAHVIRDSQSMVRGLLHTEHPWMASGATARQAAENYLRTHQELLGVKESELMNFHLRAQDDPKDTGLEYRFFSEKRHFDVSTIIFQLTHAGLPIRNAALSVHLKQLPISDSETANFQVVSSGMSRPDRLITDRLKLPLPEAVAQLEKLAPQDLARYLGIAEHEAMSKGELLRVHAHQHLMIYRYDATRRARTMQTLLDADSEDGDRLVAPDVPADILDGKDYVVAAKYFDIQQNDQASMPYVALVEVHTHAVLAVEPLAACVNGLVFQADPMTTNGGPPPTADNQLLNPRRVSVPLEGLIGPNGGQQQLIGPNVKIVDFGAPFGLPHVQPPIKPPGVDFDFDVRTDDFSAVNAYFHCDRFFRLVEELGFERANYFPGTTFPIEVDARGSTDNSLGGLLSNGIEVNAQCKMKTSVGPHGETIGGIGRTVFCLAEKNIRPNIGIANDWRVVLHELGGHGVLFGHVNSPYLGFAHSAGDSLAAILNDPDSIAPDKGRTFPWIAEFTRRHDRSVKDGWGWGGPIDLADAFPFLQREQILSSTHFRLYKSMGGDHPSDTDVRLFAAKFAVWLILRAIKTLTPETNPQHASDWLGSLLAADAEDWASHGHSGGAYAKVISWAFEKQGLFGGNPPEVDVYIDDGRGGEYPYQIDNASCPAIWNRRSNDGNEGHEAPVPNAVNFAYVKLKNRGSQTATSVVVNAFQNNSQTGRNYPNDWTALQTPSRAAADVPPQSPGMIVGPFEWTPSAGDNYILMAVSAARDPSNLSKFSANKQIPDWRLVPNDNNLGMRKV